MGTYTWEWELVPNSNGSQIELTEIPNAEVVSVDGIPNTA